MTYQLVPLGDAQRTQADPAGQQRYPAMAGLADGGAIVVWSTPRDPEAGFNQDIVARRYDATGNSAGEPEVIYSAPDGKAPIPPVVAGLDGGGYAIAWRDDASEDMRVRTFDATGAELSDRLLDLPDRSIMDGSREVEVKANPGSSITALDNGGFAVTWNAGYTGILAQYGGGATVYTQTFDATGAPVATPVQVAPWMGTGSYSWDRQNHVYDSMALDGGKYVIATRIGDTTPGNDSGEDSVALQIRDAAGAVVTPPYLAAVSPDQEMGRPSLARLGDGSFVAAWVTEADTVWRRFDADGNPLGGETALGNRYYTDPNVVALGDGGFLIANMRKSGGNPSFNGWAHRYDAAGNEVGVVKIHARGDNEINYLESTPDYVTLGDGSVLGVWYGHASWNGNLSDVLTQRFMGDRVGTAGDDSLTAEGGVTALFGMDGDDLLTGSAAAGALFGGAGADTLAGGAGSDTLDGGDGNDDIAAGAGDDGVTGGAGDDSLDGGDGADTLDGGDGNDDIAAGAGDDSVTGGDGDDSLDGGEGADTLDGGDGGDSLHGGAGDDSLDGGGGADTLRGDEGNDTLIGGNDAGDLDGGAGDDSLTGGSDADLLLGGAGDDTLDGGYGEDTLAGGAGDDLLTGGGHADLFRIGTGNDTIADFRPGTDRLEFDGVELAGAVSETVGEDRVLTLASGDTLTLLGVSSNAAPRGAPVIGGDAKEGQTLTADTSGVTDRDGFLAGSEEFRWMRDGTPIPGADSGSYVPGADDVGAAITVSWSWLDGGLVRETVTSDPTDPVAEGPKTLTGTDGDDLLTGGADADLLRGLGGDDRLIGMGGDDSLEGGDGADTINGGDGDDLIRGGDTEADRRDVIYAGSGDDSVDGGHGNDQIYGMDGNDTLAGGFGADTVEGQDGDDVITGSAFGDIVFGGAGDDFVNGGFGHDLINGGTGADKFFHVGGDADAMLGHGSDWVQDYDAAEGDVLVFGGPASADQFQVNFTHTGNRETGERSGDDGIEEAFVIYRPTGQILWALVDGGGEASINLQIGAEVFDLLG